MTTSHSPGPWKAEEERGVPYLKIRGSKLGERFKIANVLEPVYEGSRQRESDETIANARLIAAAPELLEALKESLAALEWVVEQGGGPACEHDGGVVCFCKENNAINSARAAISKAIEQ